MIVLEPQERGARARALHNQSQIVKIKYRQIEDSSIRSRPIDLHRRQLLAAKLRSRARYFDAHQGVGNSYAIRCIEERGKNLVFVRAPGHVTAQPSFSGRAQCQTPDDFRRYEAEIGRYPSFGAQLLDLRLRPWRRWLIRNHARGYQSYREGSKEQRQRGVANHGGNIQTRC